MENQTKRANVSTSFDNKIRSCAYNWHHTQDFNFSDFYSKMREISHEALSNAIEEESGDSQRITDKLRENTKFTAIKNYLTNSFGLRIQRYFYETNFFRSNEKIIVHYSLLVPKTVTCLLSFFPFVEFFAEISLLLAIHSAWSSTDSKTGFSLGNFYAGLFYTNLTLIGLSYLHAVYIGLKNSTPPRKENSIFGQWVPFILSRILFPTYFPVIKSFSSLNSFLKRYPTLEIFKQNELIDSKFGQILNQLAISKTILENIPQLIIAVLFFLSDPLKDNVIDSNNSVFQDLKTLASFVLFKSILAFSQKSWTLTKYYNSTKGDAFGIVEMLLITASNLFFVMSRVSCLIFCITFSSVYPDLQFYLFNLAQSRTWRLRNIITPVCIEEIYQSNTFFHPALIALLLVVLVSPLLTGLNLLVFARDFQLKKTDMLSVSFINIFCPFFPSENFQNRTGTPKIKIFTFLFLIFFIINVTLFTLPLMIYGINFFLNTLSILDELCRFYHFIRSNEFPKSFPGSIPFHFLYAHILYPTLSITSFVIGFTFRLIYHYKFHPGLPISLEIIEMSSSKT